jgi:hypothetical protein
MSSSLSDNFSSTIPQGSLQNMSAEESDFVEDIELLNLAEDEVLSDLSDLSK